MNQFEHLDDSIEGKLAQITPEELPERERYSPFDDSPEYHESFA